ncbi:MAG TPA: Calx-beta domain-containing protein [Pyrinomonadaceae bacterium]
MRHPWKLPLAVVCLLALAFLPLLPARRGAAQSVTYVVTDLGTLGGTQSVGLGIDECGKVVGESYPTGSTTNHPFLWNEGSFTDLGTFGGLSGSASGVVTDSNGIVAVAGSAQSATSETRPFRWTLAGGKTDIGGAGAAAAYDLNASNQVVGQWEVSPLQDRAFVWTQATGMQLITATWGTPIAAYGINNAGDIVGTAETSAGAAHAFLRSGGVTTEIGTLGGTNSFAYEVNETGVVVGYANIAASGASRPFHAIRWTAALGSSTPQDLGTLGGTRSIAYGVNASGQIVGYAEVAGGAPHAFLWSDDNSDGDPDAGEMKDLNTLAPTAGWTFEDARGINDRGQIVATAVNGSGQKHAFLLTPENVGPSPCDVPGSLQFSSPTYTVGEAGTTATITVTRTDGTDRAVSVSYATSNGTATAGSDYTAASGTLNFADGDDSETFTVPISEDALDEADETVNLTLSSPGGGASLGSQSTATLTITDNDAAPTVSVGDVTVTEGNTGTVDAVFAVTLAAVSAQTVTVNYATADNSATQPGDYTAIASTQLTFNPGETSKNVTVLVKGDTTDEANETFFVNLTSAVNATISDAQGVGTITDDDGAPSLSIGDVTVTEGNAGTTNATFTVSLLPASGQTVTVNYATADGTATTANSDYAAVSSTQITFDPGQTSKTVNVNVNGDTTPEAHETFLVNLTSPSNATISDNQAQGTINNDDTSLSINDRTIAEGNSGATAFEFTVTLSHVSVSAVSVNYATSDGTATTAGSDYNAASGTLNVPAGSTSGTVSVQVNGDTTFESNETFNVTLSGATNATISDAAGLGTITNDEASSTFQFSSATFAVGEAGPTATITVNRTGSTAGGVSVNYATSNGTAASGSDYTAASGTLNFAAGDDIETFTVAVTEDTLDEPNETVNLALSSPVGGALGATNTATLTINDNDDPPTFQFSAATYSVAESGGTATITVTRTGGTNGGVTVNYSAFGGTAGPDFTATSGTLTFGVGETSKTFDVAILEDTLDETDETVNLGLNSPVGGALGTQNTTAVLTITDNDDQPTFQLSSATYAVGEADGKATITITRTGGTNGGVSVRFTTSGGTATGGGSDYETIDSIITFAGETSLPIEVPIVNDASDETNETVTITLSAPGGGAALGTQKTATLTINDNDDPPTLSVNDVTVTEGTGGGVNATFTATLSATSGKTVTVNFATSDGTAVGSPAPASDYGSMNGTLTFNPGQTSAEFVVTVFSDGVDEPDETFNVNLSSPSNATINDGAGVGTITDDDATPTLSIGDVSATETSSGFFGFEFTVTLTGVSAQTVTVNYATADGTAVAGSDYTAASGTLNFLPNETSKTVIVAVVGDTVDEPNETFNLNLSSASNATISDGTGVGSITDDDGAPSLTVGDATVTEGNSGTVNAVFTVTLAPASGQAVSVNYATADGTAVAGSDYTAASGTLNFAAGETSKTITVQVSGDASNEANETFLVNLSGASNATVSDAQGLGTIQNDDTPTLHFSQASYPANESAHFVTVNVTRSGDSSGAVNVDFATSDGTATERKDYTFVAGTLRFAAGETSKSFDVLLTEDAFQESAETVNLTLSNPTGGAVLGTQATATVVIEADDNPPPAFNPIDVSSDFVRQHYHDFLNREPDASGLAFWTGEIEQCGADAACREVKRINVSAAFFQAIEFQETGFLVYRTFKAAYGDTTSLGVPGTVPVVRLHEFLPDTRRIGEGVVVGPGDAWKVLLEANKQAYFLEFVQRQRFTSAFPVTQTPAQFVDALYANAGVTPTAEERQAAIDEFGGAATSSDAAARARSLRRVAEHPALGQAEFRRAFVLMQYYGYLRRNPDDAPEQNLNFGGWAFWLGKLNEFNGNFVQAEMVKAFLDSTEYRNRFGQ